jgi:ribosomal protein S28E/S33
LGGSSNPTTLLIDGNKAVTATFTQNVYTLTTNVIGSGSVNRNNTGPYHYGDTVQLTALPTDGWSFDHWSGDLTGSTNPTTILINGNKAVNATFTQDEYTLDTSVVGSGIVNLNNTGPYHYGDVVELTAVHDVGWSFDHWNGDLSGSTNPTTLVMTDNKAVTATFTQNTYTLTVNVVGNGVVNRNNTGPYHYNDVIQLAADPTIGWSFDHWSGDLTGSTNPDIVTITGNKIVNATFTQDTYTLTVSTVGNGSVTRNNTGPYYYGDVVQLTGVPDGGWTFDHWSGGLSGSTNPHTIAMTGAKSVTAHFTALGTRLYIDPSLVEKGPSDIGTTFDVNVTVQYINDMWGFDFNLTWDNSLLNHVGVDFNTTLDQIWGADGWFAAYNESGAGYYQLAVVATSHGFSTTTATPLARISFKILDPLGNSLKETAIHFRIHKLSNSSGTPIAHTAEDGLYRISGGKPTLTLGTGSKTCRMYNETFTVQVNVTNAGSVEDFRFEIHYNATLLDVVGIDWNAWGSGTFTADEINGILTGYTSGSPLGGNATLLTITFNATYHHMWKDESTVTGWKNIQTGTVYIQWANLSYPTGPDLGYVRGGLNQINVGSDFEYSYSPIRGDVDNNGTVNVFDLRTIAANYDTNNPDYNLTGDSTIDIFDLVVVGSNFGYTYIP